MSINKDFYNRINIRNHPEWKEGYQSNVKNEPFPESYAFGATLEFRLGWIHAEEDNILSEYRERNDAVIL